MKYPLLSYLFAHLFVCMDFSSVTTLRNFLFFCMNFCICILEFGNFCIFWKTTCSLAFGPKCTKMGPKWGFSSFMKNQCMECLCFFLAWSNSEIKSWNWFKWFSWEKVYLIFWGQNGPKVKLFKFMKINTWNFSDSWP